MTQETPVKTLPLSEQPLGYGLAFLGGFLGGPFGLIVSPIVLAILSSKVKSKDGKQPNRFMIWALIGIVGAPTSIAIQTSAGLFSDPEESLQTQPSLVCQKPDGKYFGIVAGSTCRAPNKKALKRPSTGFLNTNAGIGINYDTALKQSVSKTSDNQKQKAIDAAKAKEAAKKAEEADQKQLEIAQKDSDKRMASLPIDKWTQSDRDLAAIACNGAKANYARDIESGGPPGKDNPFYNIMNSTKCVKWFGGNNGHPAGWTPEKDQADEEDAIRKYTVACKKAGVC